MSIKVTNQSIPRDDRAEVQLHLDVLNGILGLPDLNQIQVEVAFVAGQPVYTLNSVASGRVTDKLAELVSHQLPSPTSAALPSIAPSVKTACEFFGVAMSAAPTGVPSVDEGIDRP